MARASMLCLGLSPRLRLARQRAYAPMGVVDRPLSEISRLFAAEAATAQSRSIVLEPAIERDVLRHNGVLGKSRLRSASRRAAVLQARFGFRREFSAGHNKGVDIVGGAEETADPVLDELRQRGRVRCHHTL